jgi:hypothetical protein
VLVVQKAIAILMQLAICGISLIDRIVDWENSYLCLGSFGDQGKIRRSLLLTEK